MSTFMKKFEDTINDYVSRRDEKEVIGMLREQNRAKLMKEEKFKMKQINIKIKEHEDRMTKFDKFKDRQMSMTLNKKIVFESKQLEE